MGSEVQVSERVSFFHSVFNDDGWCRLKCWKNKIVFFFAQVDSIFHPRDKISVSEKYEAIRSFISGEGTVRDTHWIFSQFIFKLFLQYITLRLLFDECGARIRFVESRGSIYLLYCSTTVLNIYDHTVAVSDQKRACGERFDKCCKVQWEQIIMQHMSWSGKAPT